MTTITVTIEEIGGQVQHLARLHDNEDTVTAFFSPVWSEVLNWISMVRHDFGVTAAVEMPR